MSAVLYSPAQPDVAAIKRRLLRAIEQDLDQDQERLTSLKWANQDTGRAFERLVNAAELTYARLSRFHDAEWWLAQERVRPDLVGRTEFAQCDNPACQRFVPLETAVIDAAHETLCQPCARVPEPRPTPRPVSGCGNPFGEEQVAA